MTDADVFDSILASDLAAEIGREVADLSSHGLDMTAITQRIVAAFADTLADPQHGPVVIVALAAAQLRENSLHAVMRDSALSLIDSGEAANAFAADHADIRTQRRQLLVRFAEILQAAPVVETDSE